MTRLGTGALALALALLALAAPRAEAWQHLSWVAACDEPIRWALYRDERGLAARYEAAVVATFEAWSPEGSCHRFAYQGMVSGDPAVVAAQDGVTMVSFGDPLGVLSGGTILASTLYSTGSLAFFHRDREYLGVVESDIMFDDPLAVISAAQLNETCVDAVVFEALLGREIGKLLGLGDACASAAACTPAQHAAAMHWPPQRCSTQGAAPTADDLAGLLLLYHRSRGVVTGGTREEAAVPVVPLRAYLLQGAGTYLHLDEIEGREPAQTAVP